MILLICEVLKMGTTKLIYKKKMSHRCRKQIYGHQGVKWRRQWHPTPVLLPGKSHGWRSLVGCSPWGREESDTTERFHFHFSLSCIGEGNGNPLQCSCLENPRDGGAWWAAVYAVAQSRTRLKRLCSSSSSSWHSTVKASLSFSFYQTSQVAQMVNIFSTADQMILAPTI